MAARVSPGQRVLVFGLGRSGLAAARLLVKRGCQVFAHDDEAGSLDRFLAQAPEGCRPLAGGAAGARKAGVSAAVMSPGIPPTNEGVCALRQLGVPLVSELELAWQECGAPCVVVSGTNGKSSAVTMVDLLLKAAGRRSELVGNIGVPFADRVAAAERPPDWYVVEASSFQLELSDGLRPKVMAYTHYAPNHLDWHGTEQAYLAAKSRVVKNLGPDDRVVVPVGAGPLYPLVRDTRAWVVTTGPGGAFADVVVDTVAGTLSFSGARSVSLDQEAPGLPYQWRLVSCALQCMAGVAHALELHPFVLDALRAFRPLEHRLEEAGVVERVRFINDSKSTTVDATAYAIRVCPGPQVVILGGRHKGVPYAELVPLLDEKAAAVVVIGEARDLIVRDLAGTKAKVLTADTFDAALEAAFGAAKAAGRPGKSGGPRARRGPRSEARATVLLSPACASYDMFKDFEERGRRFKAWVAERGGR